MFEHEVSQALPVQAREAEEVPRSQLEYNEGLRRRGDLTVWFDEEAIANWKADKTGKPGGQRVYSDMAIETGLVVRMVYKLATDKPKASCTRSPRFSGSVSRSRTTRRCVGARGCSARSCGFRKPRALNPST